MTTAELVQAVRGYAATRPVGEGWGGLADWMDDDIAASLAGGGVGRVRPVVSAGGAVRRVGEELGVRPASLRRAVR